MNKQEKISEQRGQAVQEGAQSSATSQYAKVEQFWGHVSDVLKSDLGPATYMSWCARLSCEVVPDGKLLIVAPTAFCADWVKRNIQTRVAALWAEYSGENVDVLVETRQKTATAVPIRPDVSNAQLNRQQEQQAAKSHVDANHQTFATFVESPTNAFAASVARSLSDVGHNPPSQLVMFHGPYGNGKTHLLRAMANEMSRVHGRKVLSLTAEAFVQGFVRAVMERKADTFKTDLRDADFVLIDDVHFIAGKASSQDELTSALDDLMSAGKRVALAADRPAAAMEQLSPRLKSRLMGALACPVQAADRDLRHAFLTTKLAEMNGQGQSVEIAPEVIDWLADTVADSIRALEGALVTLAARARAGQGVCDLDAAREVLSHYARVKERKITVDDIQRKVATHYQVRLADLLSASRARNLARPRQVAMYLAKQLTTRSLPDIGRRFGGRDHTTVLHAVKRIESLMQDDDEFEKDVTAVRRSLQV